MSDSKREIGWYAVKRNDLNFDEDWIAAYWDGGGWQTGFSYRYIADSWKRWKIGGHIDLATLAPPAPDVTALLVTEAQRAEIERTWSHLSRKYVTMYGSDDWGVDVELALRAARLLPAERDDERG